LEQREVPLDSSMRSQTQELAVEELLKAVCDGPSQDPEMDFEHDNHHSMPLFRAHDFPFLYHIHGKVVTSQRMVNPLTMVHL
jgi:hypothetical protein